MPLMISFLFTEMHCDTDEGKYDNGKDALLTASEMASKVEQEGMDLPNGFQDSQREIIEQYEKLSVKF